ncbi:MAG: matrixin family metalloprotease [Candidatus Brocadiaceae bacterium]|nr:matrixin family metalloprotease [Candidatus Brocadiaceae bacterium]
MNLFNLRRVSLFMTILAVCMVCVGCPKTHNLQVRRHITTTPVLSNARADSILSNASTILQTNDGAGDVACDVRMVRSGNVTAFTTGNGIINSSADFNAVISLPGHAKVVRQINWCGRLIPNVIGCAPRPGNSFAVVRRSNVISEAILWTHEFGHNKGLTHRNGTRAVMRPTININNKRINSTECSAYRN